jgi:uncharacterized protein
VNLPDTNVWLALALTKHVFHAAAIDWFAAQQTERSILLCRATQQSLLRLLTTDAVMQPYGVPPLTNANAWKVHDDLLSDRRIAWAAEPNGIDAYWKTFANCATASPKLWMDAYLAAFAAAAGHRLITTDKAFRQFKGLDHIVLEKKK